MVCSRRSTRLHACRISQNVHDSRSSSSSRKRSVPYAQVEPLRGPRQTICRVTASAITPDALQNRQAAAGQLSSYRERPLRLLPVPKRTISSPPMADIQTETLPTTSRRKLTFMDSQHLTPVDALNWLSSSPVVALPSGLGRACLLLDCLKGVR